MPDVIQAMLAAGAVPTATLPATSRYAGVGICVYVPADGTSEPTDRVPYFCRRLCPPAEGVATLYEYTVVAGDRRDLIAARQLGDAALWWRVADANAVIDPHALTQPIGRRLRITLPEGVPAGPT